MAEWSIAAVLKTVDVKASGGSSPSSSAGPAGDAGLFFFQNTMNGTGSAPL